jgi:putative spermidine/putrescine transport system ATP-binding protein/spermidine/putrescine transport system ATP-binding protein
MADDAPDDGSGGRTAMVRLDRVSKRFGDLVAVDEVSLTVARGEMLTLLGPSGCGKTTLLNLIAGFVEPSGGRIEIAGHRVDEVPPHLRKLGVVFQSYALFPHLSVAQNVAFGLRMRGVPRAELRQRVAAALDLVRLAGLEERRPHQLSGGQQQRVALARALVIDPDVLLLDEPLSALDKNLRGQMQIELKDIQRRVGVTTIFVTHDQGEALSLSDRIAVLSHGVVQQVASPQEMYREPATGFVAAFVGETNRLLGKVVDADRATARVALETGEVCAVPLRRMSPPETGRKVAVYIRPEAIALAPRAGNTRGNTAAIRTVVFQGAYADLIVESEAGPLLRVRMPAGADRDWVAGMKVTPVPDWTAAHLFED